MYDVRDLIDSMAPDFVPPEVGLSESEAHTRDEAAEEKSKPLPVKLGKRKVETEPEPSGLREIPAIGELFERESDVKAPARAALETVVNKYLTPPTSDPQEQISCTRGGVLVAHLTPEQHTWLEDFLTAQRMFAGFIEVEAQLFTVSRGRLRALGIESSSAALTVDEREAFVAGLQEDPRTQRVNAPALTTHTNQRANVSIINQIAYVKDYTIEVVEPNRREIADPQIAVIKEGVVLDVRATPLAANEFGLDMQLTNCKLKRPITTKKVRLSTATETEVEIGLPEVSTVRIKTTVRLAEGASIVLSTPGHDDTDLVMVVTAKRVELAEISDGAHKHERR